MLPEARTAEGTSAFRTQSEQNAILVLHHILGFDMAKGLEAGVISRWLAQYPFGGPDASNYNKKISIVEILEDNSYYDGSEFGDVMRGILSHMFRSLSTHKEMAEHDLLDVIKDRDINVSVALPSSWVVAMD